MDKPDWKGAPEWAMWLAQDPFFDDGARYVWFENKPDTLLDCWSADGGRYRETHHFGNAEEWTTTLEPRP